MDISEVIRGRRSVRAFTRKKVSQRAVELLIDAARWAPSAGNIQPWEFVIVTQPENQQRLAAAALDQTFVAEAPVVIVVCANVARSALGYGNRGAHLYSLQDTAAATENLLLAAHALGLAACWVGAFREDDVAEAINAPRGLRPVAIVPVGYPAEKPRSPTKRPIPEIVHYETF